MIRLIFLAIVVSGLVVESVKLAATRAVEAEQAESEAAFWQTVAEHEAAQGRQFARKSFSKNPSRNHWTTADN